MIMTIFMRGAVMLVVLLLPMATVAYIDAWTFDDPVQSDRYKALTEELRCPKCQNQNVAESNAPIANDLRAEVYRMLQAGESDEQIVSFMLDRYGDFVLYKPRLSMGTLLLWFGPVLFLCGGGVTLVAILRRNRQDEVVAEGLSLNEKIRLKQLLEGHKQS